MSRPDTPDSPRSGIRRVLRRRRGWIVAAVMLAVAAALAYTAVTLPRYTATVRLLYDHAAPQDGAAETIAAAIDTQPHLLVARNVLTRTIADEGLVGHPLFGQRPAGLRMRLLQRAGLSRMPADPADKALAMLERAVAAHRVDRSFIVELSVTTEDPTLSARIANAIARRYLDEDAAARAEAGTRTDAALSGRLDEARDRLRQAEAQVEHHKAEARLAQGPDEQQLRELSAQLVAARVQSAELRTRLDQLRDAERRRIEPDALPEPLQSKTLAVLVAALADVRRQAADQQARLGPRHPAVAAADSQMRETRQQVQDELARLVRAAAAEHERARAQEAAIERRVEALQADARRAGEQAAQLRELERDAATRRAVYDALLVRAREADAAPPTRVSATRIIAPAVAPVSPSSLPALILVAASLLLGLGAGSGLALVAERLDDRLRDVDRFAAVGGVPILAVVPEGRRLSARRFRALAVAPDAAGRKGRSLGVAYPSAERLDALYRLASALGIGMMGPSARTIVFTSPEPTDSRPACVVDLGLAVAAGGRGVVIVDADTRGRRLSRLVGAGDGGLVELLEERASLADVALTDHLTGLKVVPLARATASRLARFAPSRIRAAVETTGDEPVDLLVDASDPHDHVIVPSVLALADATVMIVRNGHTRARTLQQAMAALRNSGVRVTGLVVVV